MQLTAQINQKRLFEIFDREFRIMGGSPVTIISMSHQPDTKAHYHDFHELVIVFAGHSHHISGSESYPIGSGDVFLVPPGEYHAYQASRDLRLANILYWPERLNLPLYDLRALPGYHAFFELEPELRSGQSGKRHLQINQHDLITLTALCDKLAETLLAGESGKTFRSVIIFMQILELVATAGERAVAEQNSSRDHDKIWRFSRILSAIEANPAEAPNLHSLARNFGMSDSTLYRLFMEVTGRSPKNYCQELKINHAKGLLSETNLTIAQIANECGFSDPNYFVRLFGKYTGTSPGRFRSQKFENPTL